MLLCNLTAYSLSLACNSDRIKLCFSNLILLLLLLKYKFNSKTRKINCKCFYLFFIFDFEILFFFLNMSSFIEKQINVIYVRSHTFLISSTCFLYYSFTKEQENRKKKFISDVYYLFDLVLLFKQIQI